jgi:hypothetical protein
MASPKRSRVTYPSFLLSRSQSCRAYVVASMSSKVPLSIITR